MELSVHTHRIFFQQKSLCGKCLVFWILLPIARDPQRQKICDESLLILYPLAHLLEGPIQIHRLLWRGFVDIRLLWRYKEILIDLWLPFIFCERHNQIW